MLFDNMDDKHEGTVIRKPGSKKLYVLFYYYGRRVEKSTGLDDTPPNRKKIKTWLDRQMEKVETNRFIFAEAFPSAPEAEKAWFARKEGWDYQPEPKDIMFGDYVRQWYLKIWINFESLTKKEDWKGVIDYWLLPHFGEMSFYQISGTEVKSFISSLKIKKGSNKGNQLSKKRIKIVLIPFRAIWNDACDDFRWMLPDPFRNLKRHMPESPEIEFTVLRFDEWQKILVEMHPWYKPIAEIMLLTGMINSEIAGLRKADITGDHILVKNTIVRKREKEKCKTIFRTRKIPITKAIRERLDIATSRSTTDYVFTNTLGHKFERGIFRDDIWKRAFKKAGIGYKRPYIMRHTFAAWALTLKIDLLRLVNLMGHRDKKMVFEVYGNYTEGLEQDAIKILNYFGHDFITPEINQHSIFAMQQALLPHLAWQMQQLQQPSCQAACP